MSSLADFKAAFEGDLVFPEDAEYPSAIARWSITAERKAAIVAFVKTNKDVGLAIKYAKANNLPIAIRGGGHNPAGTSSAEGGLVIDLSKHFTGARVDPEKKLIYVGGGALWKTVDEAAIKHGLATVGGTVNHVR
jgi:FAD/FMN-containing dehydrogenase